jgi:hypothetical protein
MHYQTHVQTMFETLKQCFFLKKKKEKKKERMEIVKIKVTVGMKNGYSIKKMTV